MGTDEMRSIRLKKVKTREPKQHLETPNEALQRVTLKPVSPNAHKNGVQENGVDDSSDYSSSSESESSEDEEDSYTLENGDSTHQGTVENGVYNSSDPKEDEEH